MDDQHIFVPVKDLKWLLAEMHALAEYVDMTHTIEHCKAYQSLQAALTDAKGWSPEGSKRLAYQYAIADILDSLIRAEEKHPGWPLDLCRQSCILTEEAGEVTQAVLNFLEHAERTGKYSFDLEDKIHKELTHTGAMVLRFLMSRYPQGHIHVSSVRQPSTDHTT